MKSDQINLKEFREKHSLTQVDMAREIRVSVQAYRLWESGVGSQNPKNKKALDAFMYLKNGG